MPRPPFVRTPSALGWVLIANSARARSFVRDPDNKAMRELCSFVHPESRLKGAALQMDRGGKVQKSAGASSQFAPTTDPHRKEHAAFARELADYLEEAALSHRYPEVSLLASKGFLGELRLHLGPATQKLLKVCVPVDLTTYEGSDLEHRVAQALHGQVVIA